MAATDAFANALAGSAATNWVALEKVDWNGRAPLKSTTEVAMNPVPLMVTLIAALPAMIAAGVREVISGVGLETLGGADWLRLPPPQPARSVVNNKRPPVRFRARAMAIQAHSCAHADAFCDLSLHLQWGRMRKIIADLEAGEEVTKVRH